MSFLHQKAGVLRFISYPILLFVLIAICVACNSSDVFLVRAESLAEKVAYMDSLLALNREPAEFVKATNEQTMFGGNVSPDFDKAAALLKKDIDGYAPIQDSVVDLRWREVSDSICFYYCNEGEDAVITADSLSAIVLPADGLKWIHDQEEVKRRVNNSMFDRALDPFPVLDMIEKTRYLAFINNDCVIFPYAQSLFFSSLNQGAARLTVKLFDLTDRSYQPVATFPVFAMNSRTISVTETDHQMNGKSVFKSSNASDRVKEDLSNNLIQETKRAVYHALVSAK